MVSQTYAEDLPASEGADMAGEEEGWGESEEEMKKERRPERRATREVETASPAIPHTQAPIDCSRVSRSRHRATFRASRPPLAPARSPLPTITAKSKYYRDILADALATVRETFHMRHRCASSTTCGASEYDDVRAQRQSSPLEFKIYRTENQTRRQDGTSGDV